MLVTALWKKEYWWYLPAVILMGLAWFRFYWLGKRLKE